MVGELLVGGAAGALIAAEDNFDLIACLLPNAGQPQGDAFDTARLEAMDRYGYPHTSETLRSAQNRICKN